MNTKSTPPTQEELIDQIQQFDQVRAVFTPKRTDDLKAGCKAFIGQEGVFEAAWIQESDEQYVGQWAMSLPEEWREIQRQQKLGDEYVIWVPACDLTILEIMERKYD